MRVIYVAGPFRGQNSWEIEENIRRSERLALEVWRLGAACICPHTNTRFYQGAAPDSVWLDGDLEILGRCDGVMLTEDWQRSAGARAEVEYAKARGIPVFLSLEALDRWLRRAEPDAVIGATVRIPKPGWRQSARRVTSPRECQSQSLRRLL